MRPNLIIAAIGDGHVVGSWFNRESERTFDLFAVDFRPGPRTPPPQATYFVQRSGFKFEHLSYLI